MTREEVAAALRCRSNLGCEGCAQCAYGIRAGNVWCCDFRGICEDALKLIEGEGGDYGGMAD